MLTIAIPVFERRQYFEKALNSALQQTYKCKVLVVDNNSSHDYFKEICNQKEVEYYKNESNIGVFPNWNRCFALSKTEFVLILSDDDILEPDYITRFIDTLEKYPKLDLFYSDFSILNYPTLSITNHGHILPFGYFENGDKVIEYGIKYKLGFPVITSAIRKSKFTGFYTDEHGSNDWVWLYSNIQNFTIFGDEKNLLKRGSHSSNDSGNPVTHQKCVLSIAYLYDNMAFSAQTQNLKQLAFSNRDSMLVYFTFIAERSLLKQLNEAELTYALFYKKFLTKSIYRFVMTLPLFVRKNIYRFAILFKIVDRV